MLKDTFRETYLTVNPHRTFSITDEEWNELSIFIQNSIVKWNLVDCAQLIKIKWIIHAFSIKFEKMATTFTLSWRRKQI